MQLHGPISSAARPHAKPGDAFYSPESVRNKRRIDRS